MAIDYIVNSTKPYPHWIKEHRVFKNLSRIDKVFPSIGLPNFEEEININQTSDSSRVANNFVIRMFEEFSSKKSLVQQDLQRIIYSDTNTREHNKSCNDHQNIINILAAFQNVKMWFGYEAFIKKGEKISLIIPGNVFSGAKETPIFKKGQSFIGAISSINEMLATLGSSKMNYEEMSVFKEFSRLNVPAKPYRLHFSSTGEDGAWDIATASMRGIASCQSWTMPQARGLIGSISSKYVGVIFIEGNENYAPYGAKMLFRCLVRLIIDKRNGKPYLFTDAIYPNSSPEITKAIREALSKRTTIEVLMHSSPSEKSFALTNCIVMDEPSRSDLREGEYSYMDTVIPTRQKPFAILTSTINSANSTFRKSLIDSAVSEIGKKYSFYKEISTKYASLNYKKELGEEISPQDNPVYDMYFGEPQKGPKSVATIMNFFSHFLSGKAGEHSSPQEPFINAIFDSLSSSIWSLKLSEKEFLGAVYRDLTGNSDEIKRKAKEILASGSWNKSFKRTSERFLDITLSALKQECVSRIKQGKNVA